MGSFVLAPISFVFFWIFVPVFRNSLISTQFTVVPFTVYCAFVVIKLRLAQELMACRAFFHLNTVPICAAAPAH